MFQAVLLIAGFATVLIVVMSLFHRWETIINANAKTASSFKTIISRNIFYVISLLSGHSSFGI